MATPADLVSFSSDFFVGVINGIADPLFVKDRQHRWVFCNDAFCRWLDQTRSKVLGQSDDRFFLLEQAQRWWAIEKQVFLTGLPHTLEEQLVDARGELQAIATRRVRVQDETGQCFVMGTIRDISEQRQVEAELKRSEAEIREQALTLIELSQSKDLSQGDRDRAFAEMTTAAARTLQVERASLWLFDASRTKLQCIDLFEHSQNRHSQGPELGVADYPSYFAALAAEPVLATSDAQTDARTQEFTAGYLIPLGIAAMLDASLQLSNQVIGVVCFEHVGSPRQWTQAEQNFAKSIANLASLALEVSERQAALRERDRVEEKLRQSEEMLWLVLDTIPQSIFWKDRNSVYLGCNRKQAEVAGLRTPEDIVGKTDDDLPWTEEETKSYQLSDRRIMESNTPEYHILVTRLQADGAQTWCDVSKIPLHDAAGNVIGILGTVEDITERQKIEAALQEQEKQFRTLVHNLPGVVYRCLNDDKWTMLFVSDAAESLFGYPADAFTHHRISFADLMADEDVLRVNQTIQQALAQRQPYMLEYSIQRADGEIRWVYEKGQGIFDETGQMLCLDGVIFDISDRKLAEKALEASEAQYRDLVQTANCIILRWDTIGTITFLNDYGLRFFGFTAPELIGRSVIGTIVPETETSGRDLAQLMLNICRNPDSYALNENENLCRDGRRVWIAWGNKPVFDEQGQLLEILSVGTDVTERRRAEEALRQSEAQLRHQTQTLEQAFYELQQTQTQLVQSEKMSSLGQLVAGIAHEINNPVNFISGNISYANNYAQDLLGLIQLYQDHYPEPAAAIRQEATAIDLEFLMEDLPKLLHSMKIGAERIQSIVASLRTFSRMDEAEMKAVNIHEGIDSTLMILHHRLKAKSDRPEIEVVKQYGNLPLVECYAGQLNQVFMNILCNAIDALEENLAEGQSQPIPADQAFRPLKDGECPLVK